MFAKVFTIAATSIAAAHACTTTTQFPNNPITAPTVADYPTIGQPFLIQWDNTGQGPTVTLSLYTGCPNNCVALTDIVDDVENTGSYSWTPACTLEADTTNEGYGILLTDNTLCMTQWSFHFGLHPDTAGVCTGKSVTPSSTTVAVVSPTSTATSTTTTATSKATSAASSTTTTLTTAQSTTTTATSIPVLTKSTTVQGQSTSKTSGTTATASSTSDGVSTRPAQALSAFAGVFALLAAVLVF